MKSEPIIGDVTSAIINGQQKLRLRPRSSLTHISPITLMGEPFAANNFMVVGRMAKLAEVRGSTETSAPLSTKKFLCEFLSIISRRKIWRSVEKFSLEFSAGL